LEGDLERLHDDFPKLETSLKCCLCLCGAAAYLEPKEEMYSFCHQVRDLEHLVSYLGIKEVSHEVLSCKESFKMGQNARL
ncbi:hypothetical protein Tco_0023372, partial [Tanacetum coccineum]